MPKITPQQLAKTWRREHGEDAFRAEHGCSRTDWVEREVRNGSGRKEAQAKSRQMMADAREKDTNERVDAASRWHQAMRWLNPRNGND
jgi:hypothetical protein